MWPLRAQAWKSSPGLAETCSFDNEARGGGSDAFARTRPLKATMLPSSHMVGAFAQTKADVEID